MLARGVNKDANYYSEIVSPMYIRFMGHSLLPSTKLIIMCLYSYKTISVFGQRDWRLILVPAYHVYPDLVEVLEGMKVTLYCGSSIPVIWTFTPQNSNAGVRLKLPLYTLGRSVVSDQIVTVMNTPKNESGYYNCEGRYDNLYFFHYSSVKVFTEVLYGQVLPNWMVTSEGDSVTITCGSIKPVEWFSAHSYRQNETLESNTVTIHNIKRENSGPYVCRGVNVLRNIFHDTALIVVYSDFDIV